MRAEETKKTVEGIYNYQRASNITVSQELGKNVILGLFTGLPPTTATNTITIP